MKIYDKFSYNKNQTKVSFTLVELIIVITILAILSVSAFLVVSQWIGKSRDSRRLSDLGTIQRALEVSLTENAKYPTPDSAVNITAGSIIIGQQGKFGDSARSATDIKTTPMDPLDNVAYTYYVATGGEDYQIMGFLENSSTLTFRGIEAQGPRSTVNYQENLQFSNSACTCNSNGTNSICSVASLAFCLNYAHASEVSAADYSVRIPTVKGETLGILILSGTNQPVEELGSTVDLNTSTSNLIAVFSDTDKSSGTGGQILSPITIKNSSIENQSNIISLDKSLVAYYDMESVNSNGTLKDLSSYSNNGVCYNSASVVNCGTNGQGPQLVQWSGKPSKAMKFDGTDDGIRVTTSSVGISSGMTVLVSIQLFDQLSGSYVFHKDIIRSGCIGGGLWGISTDGNYNSNGLLSSDVRWVMSGTNWQNNNATTKTTKNSNSFLGLILDRDTLTSTVFINGISYPQNNATLSTKPTTTGFGIGYDCGGTINGVIDEIRIYNRVLSGPELQALYNASK